MLPTTIPPPNTYLSGPFQSQTTHSKVIYKHFPNSHTGKESSTSVWLLSPPIHLLLALRTPQPIQVDNWRFSALILTSCFPSLLCDWTLSTSWNTSLVLYALAVQSVINRPPASASLGSLLAMQNLQWTLNNPPSPSSFPLNTESDTSTAEGLQICPADLAFEHTVPSHYKVIPDTTLRANLLNACSSLKV